MNKTVFVILFSASLVINCSDKDDVALNKCFVTVLSSDSEAYTFTYTPDDKLKTTTRTFNTGAAIITETTTVTYDSKGNISKTQSKLGYNVYTYNANNQVSREESYFGTELIRRLDYEYNSSNQLVKAEDFVDTGVSGGYFVYEYASTDSKNPIKETSYYSNGELQGTTEYEYDTKLTPFSAIGLGAYTDVAEQQNNVTKSIAKDYLGELISTTTIVYEYNDKGYPTKVTETEVSDWGSDEYVLNYTYNCK
jgi:hypothetical protein